MTEDERKFAESHNISAQKMEFFSFIYKREQRFKTAIWILSITNAALLALLLLTQLLK